MITAKELLNKQLDDVTYQVEKVLGGVKAADLDFKITPTAMSIREIIEHLCEVYVSLDAESRGEAHAWGSFSIADKSWTSLQAQFLDLRAKALSIANGAEDGKTVTLCAGYIVAHDSFSFYHILEGQELCSAGL